MAVNDQGHTWRPFVCSYDSPEGTFSLTIFAISHEHALLQVDAIKETLRLDGEQIYGQRSEIEEAMRRAAQVADMYHGDHEEWLYEEWDDHMRIWSAMLAAASRGAGS